MARKSQSIRESDAAQLLRLAFELGELGGDPAARRLHLLRGLRRLAGAQSIHMFHLVAQGDGRFKLPQSIDFADTDFHIRQAFMQYMTTGDPMDPAVPILLARARSDPLFTVHRQAVVSDAKWYRSRHYEQLRAPARIDHHLYSNVTLGDGRIVGIGMQRERGDKPFDDRDCQVVNLFHSQMRHLYGQQVAAPRESSIVPIPPLAPRLRPVLRHLLEGDAEKQVAMKLGLSRHTVHQYIKVLYRELGVSSRGELLAKFIRSNARQPGSQPR
jgi:DNA-binding CsgD family transcriptional regulator